MRAVRTTGGRAGAVTGRGRPGLREGSGPGTENVGWGRTCRAGRFTSRTTPASGRIEASAPRGARAPSRPRRSGGPFCVGRCLAPDLPSPGSGGSRREGILPIGITAAPPRGFRSEGPGPAPGSTSAPASGAGRPLRSQNASSAAPRLPGVPGAASSAPGRAQAAGRLPAGDSGALTAPSGVPGAPGAEGPFLGTVRLVRRAPIAALVTERHAARGCVRDVKELACGEMPHVQVTRG